MVIIECTVDTLLTSNTSVTIVYQNKTTLKAYGYDPGEKIETGNSKYLTKLQM